jgi:hypothetical protein
VRCILRQIPAINRLISMWSDGRASEAEFAAIFDLKQPPVAKAGYFFPRTAF